MEVLLSFFLSLPIIVIIFAIITWFWWNISRNFFIFLSNYSEERIKSKKNSWKLIIFNYGIFGPLGIVSISGYLYVSLIFFKFFIYDS